MVSTKYLIVLLFAALAAAEESVVVPVVEDFARQAPPAPMVTAAPADANAHWTDRVRVSVNAAAERLSQNMVTVLGALAETSREAGLNGTRAFAFLTRAIVTNSIDLTGVVAYMPRLLLLDLPNQFTEVLRLVRRNEVRFPSSVNEAIDSILVLTRQAEVSGITNRLFGPIVRFMPNILNGAHDFLQDIFTTMFTAFGVTNLPTPTYSPIPDANDTLIPPVVSTTQGAPSARYFHYY